MSKVTMPEPVVYRSKDTPYLFSLDGPETDGFEGLITTTQAEAYKDACVREALEEALGIVELARESIGAGALAENAQYERSIVEPHLDGIDDEIRALIPPHQ